MRLLLGKALGKTCVVLGLTLVLHSATHSKASAASDGEDFSRDPGLGSCECLAPWQSPAWSAQLPGLTNVVSLSAWCCRGAEDILLAFKASVENWDEVFTSRGLLGWAPCTAGKCLPLCSWSGVGCSPFETGYTDRVTDL